MVLNQRGGEGYEKRGVRGNEAFAPSAQGKLEVGYFSRADHGVGILWKVTSLLLFIHDVYKLSSR